MARALFTTCGRNILPGAEQIADRLHAVHQRTFDHVERPRQLLAGLFSVLLDEVDDAVDERVREPPFDRLLAPREVHLALRPAALHLAGERNQPLGRVRPAVEEHVLDVLEQVRRNVFVDGELAGVHDPHVEPGFDRVVEERRVHRLADDVVAAEGERQVADAAADLDARARRP